MEFEIEQILKVNYANLQDKHQLENLVVEHRATIDNLLKQIHQLVSIKDKEQLERDIILNKMQENMLENTQQIINFKNLVNQSTDQHHKLAKEFEEEKDRNRKNADSQHQLEINELSKKLEETETEYRQLHPIEEREAAYLEQIKSAKEGLVARQYQHHDEMNQEEKRQERENKELSSANQTRIQEVKKNVYQVARDMVVEEKLSNEEKNQQLRNQLVVLQGQLSEIKKQRSSILVKRKELKINLSINQEELEEYKAVGSLQKAKIKSYKDKIDTLKIFIDQEVSKRTSEIATIKKTRTAQTKALKARLLQVEKEQEEMKIRTEQMKVLAETILMQREEVEQFFIMALEGCKKDLEKEKEGLLGASRDNETKSYGDKVDIEELTTKDKQRILTNLYTKLALGP